MSDDGKFIADTLESVIVGMAESLREAQEELSEAAPLDAYGRPVPQYRIPHLDFEIGFKLVTDTKSGGGMRVIFGETTDRTRDVTSTISGRFVAVPPGEGLPLPVLTLEIKGTGNTRDITVTAATSAGELLSGAQVELNVDKGASTALSAAAGVAAPRLDGQVSFGRAVVETNETGIATTTLTFGSTLQRAAVVVITAELGGETVRVLTGKDL
ncbi:hypothetical protein ACVDG3_13440 [Meridianimarinicoccus sp. RP-17]|uniref:hypothetical protein n=1 Tax=Meridianimarinicoccus zhengii TaxID=2056810 RepID=UPI000DAC88AB|nr:hypothetical protein [Phycocomes zhengii]